MKVGAIDQVVIQGASLAEIEVDFGVQQAPAIGERFNKFAVPMREMTCNLGDPDVGGGHDVPARVVEVGLAFRCNVFGPTFGEW